VAAPHFRIQRDAGWDDDKLGPDGWQSSDALLRPDSAEASGADLMLHVGWGICRHLEAGVYEISVPGANAPPMSLAWPDIAPLHAGVSGIVSAPSAPTVEVAPPLSTPRPTPATLAAPPVDAPELAPVPEAALPPPVPITAPASLPQSPAPAAAGFLPSSDNMLEAPVSAPAPAPAHTRSFATVAGCLAVLLLMIGGGFYYWQHHGPAETAQALVAPPHIPVPPPAAAATPDPAPPPTAAPGLGSLSVPEVLARAPSIAAIAAEGERRLQSDRRDDGLLLLETAADRSDSGAAASLARLYDPVLFQPGGALAKPDARQAARYYRDAARGGTDVAAPRDALRRNLQSRVQAGDLGADLSLKDFWP
jgi:hypothetical protein